MRKYKCWTEAERKFVADYVNDNPSGVLGLTVLGYVAEKLGRSTTSIRGAITREMKRVRELAIREE